MARALLLLLFLAARPALAETWSLTLGPVEAATVRDAGGQLVAGPGFSATLEPGVGVWSGDRTTLVLTAERPSLRWEPEPDDLSGPVGPIRLAGATVLRAPGWEVILHGGDLVRDGSQLRYRGAAAPKAGAAQWAPLLVVGALILLLLRRSAHLRRRLDEPRVPLRRRGAPHSD